jgi:SAM-dependent methyltransferase
MRPYQLLSSYYHYHWERYCLEYLPFLAEVFSNMLPAGEKPVVCDMGCGTGRLTYGLLDQGFEAYGVDPSPEMLAVARDQCDVWRTAERDADCPAFHLGDMRDFLLPRKTHCIVIAYDAINYLENAEEISRSLRHLASQIDDRGVIVFDFNTPEIYRRYDGVREEISVPGGRILQITRFDRRERRGHTEFRFEIDGERQSERHIQAVYTPREMKDAVAASGLELAGAFDDFDFKPLRRRSQKPLFILRKPQRP